MYHLNESSHLADLCGIAVKHLKMYWIMAGYITLSQEGRSKYDTEKVATGFRNGMFAIGFVMILGYYFGVW